MNATAVRKLIDLERRQQLGLPAHHEGHGYESRYKQGCRCEPCRRAANEARLERRRRERERTTCPTCRRYFRWPGLLDHHHSTSACGRAA